MMVAEMGHLGKSRSLPLHGGVERLILGFGCTELGELGGLGGLSMITSNKGLERSGHAAPRVWGLADKHASLAEWEAKDNQALLHLPAFCLRVAPHAEPLVLWLSGGRSAQPPPTGWSRGQRE